MKHPADRPAKPATPEGERIAKYLSRAGVASRREAERMIELGQVAVNGKVIDSPALNITPKDRISVNGKPVAPPEAARLWLYYKPEGLVTSASDEKGRETVFDALPEDMPRVMSVGRLDLNSEGLLLLTNDGELKRRLELPSTGWLRRYRVRVKGNPTDVDLEPLRRGITVEGERFQPMQVVMDRHQGANAWLTVGLREGKNREIRRAMAEIGLAVNRLIRISYGPFRLGELQPGEVEEVRPKVLKDQLGLTEAEEPTPRPKGATGARPAKPGRTGGPDKPERPRRDAQAAPARPAKPRGDQPGEQARSADRSGKPQTSPRAQAGKGNPFTRAGRTAEDRPQGGKSFGSKPQGAKPLAAKPLGARPQGSKPQGSRSQGPKSRGPGKG